MSKEPSTTGRFSRLSDAVRKAREDSISSNQLAGKRTGSAKPAQRAIRYPNNSTALRALVTETQQTGSSGPSVRLRVTPRAHAAGEDEPKARGTGRAQLMPGSTHRIATRPGPGGLEPEQSQRLRAIRTTADIGEVVRRARRNRELTQAQLAALARTGRRFISELEAGKPTLEFERLLSVCNVLEINLFATAPDR